MLRGMHVEAGIQSLVDDHVLPVPTSSLEALLAPYDFFKVKVALVCSIPGKFKGEEMQKVGHTGLMRALRNIGARCHSDKRIALECQVSQVLREHSLSMLTRCLCYIRDHQLVDTMRTGLTRSASQRKAGDTTPGLTSLPNRGRIYLIPHPII